MSKSSGKRAVAQDVWRSLFEVFVRTRWRRDAVLERLGLTPNDAKALHTLDPVQGQPMRALATAWGTDASNATWVVDRLEKKGLAKRQALASDRRVKLVILTPRGVKTRNALFSAFHEPPEEFIALERQDLVTLGGVLDKLLESLAEQQPTTLG